MATETVKRAVRVALADWLTTQVGPLVANLTVLDAWPVPGMQLATPTLSVVTPGQVQTWFYPATPYATLATGPGATGLVTYSYGWVEVDVQVDAWAKSPAERDDLALALEGALNASPYASLGVAPLSSPFIPDLQRRGGLVLALASLYGAPCDYGFEGTPDAVEDDNAAHADDWRATATGTACLHLATQEQCALVQRLLLQFPDHTFHVP